ncbi:hypothetical protein MGYG_07886 [Nannizzia gypsea CBS 118893]|uniref:MEI5 protein n=1 Tax=Arthroderma gypseum (strain ATCC MYA-4604 / CBS 118893) TaxID=535722 RepID=E4V4G1_ARTGP|nr:hypothetical protein MGYG_07886 [Nannizzia gypsea CBS 118893]EFR04885.1 hypothetical protein MGYG_07886 [Nannizzia gypsea CBS 118893]
MASTSKPAASVAAHVTQLQNQTPDVQAMKDVLARLKELLSAPGFNALSAVYNENTKLQNQLQARDEDIKKLREEMEKKEKHKEIAMDEMFAANEKEKNKHNKTIEQVKELQTAAGESEKHLAEQQAVINELKDKHAKLESDYASQAEHLTRADKDIGDLKKTLKEREAYIDKLKAAGSEQKQILLSQKKNIKELGDQISSLEGSLQANQSQLSKLEGFAVGYQEIDEASIVNKFDELWSFATTEIHSCLTEDLSSKALQDRTAWDHFRKWADTLRHRIPLPHSNSSAAKDMRLVLTLAILAREIDRQIFQPTYIFPEDNQLREILVDLAATDSEKELFSRRLLLSINPEAQAEAGRSRIQAVVRNTSQCFFKLLSESKYEEFRRCIEKVAQRAADFWQPIQRAKSKYEPDFEPTESGDPEWKPFVFPGGPENGPAPAESRPSDGGQAEELLTVFPCISAIENNVCYPLNTVTQVWKPLPQCAAAEQELAQRPTKPTVGRMASNRERRRSLTVTRASNMNGNHQNGNFLGQKAGAA